MSSVAGWDTFAGAAGIAFLLATLRLRVDFGDPLHAILFAVVFVAGFVLVLGGISPPDLQAQLLQFRLSPVGKAVEWSAGIALTVLVWVVLDRPLAAVVAGIVVAYWWFRREDYYAELREERERLLTGQDAQG